MNGIEEQVEHVGPPDAFDGEFRHVVLRRHAEDIAAVSDNEWLRADGCKYVLDRLAGVYSVVRPANSKERIDTGIRFHKAKIAAISRLFDRLKQAWNNPDANPVNWDHKLGEQPEPTDDEDDPTPCALRRLKELHDRHKAALKVLEDEHTKLPEVIAARQAAAHRQRQNAIFTREANQRQERVRKQIDSIQLDD